MLLFQGFLVGNGMSDWAMNSQSLMYFGNYHGLWGERYVKYDSEKITPQITFYK